MNMLAKLCGRLVLLAVLAVSSLATAQQSDWGRIEQLSQGQLIKIVLANSEARSGKFQSATDSTVVVSAGNKDNTFSRDDISLVLLKHGGHRGRHALIGAAVGAGAGLGTGAAIDNGCTKNSIVCTGNAGKAILTPAFAAIGAVIGAVLPSGGWTEIHRK